MQVGDLVKLKCPTTRDFKNAFLVTDVAHQLIKVLGHNGWQCIKDFEAINESR